MGAQTIRFLIQVCFALAGLLAVVFVASPFGPTLGFFLLVFGLWLGRRVFKRIATLDEIRQDLRQRVDDGP
ncbi:MAG: hypothetical protein RIE06_18435 [Roseibium album]|uniref:DUF4229 domain-containing protein n=1 Tax=Roseibium album TaxID=311410 RepID=A0A0M7AIF3_9HYPH|nr:hypothetical protein [Roseibium album]MBG6155346.1 hypothetical protein [Labrenzia sp. EL_162]MBG6166869.1 hypothetical protein [Labrenzia sp. EL_195]MBG6173671.1 hypothetical protein [Labrenzia sp. EL_132]MBG6192525.1 hypothetical protein [Labrenzia sp. EL_159]MBG6198910.1 hypothetical protein [Labrenzia sp. EL_13]MBG6228873.1 hypothetical protein [Labrenzia sp. EL_208]MCR9059903.1 hypothetical protein [Paracoccaceae bacterium]